MTLPTCTGITIGDGSHHSGNITSSFNIYQSDQEAQIMPWLSPLEPNIRHEGVCEDRFDRVGRWLLDTNEFREWRGSEGGADKAVLFCCGNPGVGKTYLSSLVIDELCNQVKKQEIVVACFYCDSRVQNEQTVVRLIGAIFKQLVRSWGIPESLHDAFQQAKKEIGGRGLRLPDMMRLLRITIASLPQVFICIDALDELLPKNLPNLLKSLSDIVSESPRTRIFLTGRPHVTEDIRTYFSSAVVIPISPRADDIRNFLQMRFEGDTSPEAMNDDLRAHIIGVIMEKISDIFLLVSLTIDAVLGQVTIRQRKEKLEEMTKGDGLSGAYTATLTRLKAQEETKSILGLKVLMWVLYSERPLRAEELCHALGVNVGFTDLDVENVPALRALLASCLGLVTVEASSSTIRLVHNTLQEHVASERTLFHSPHSTIAEVCLTYLNFKCVRGLPPICSSAPVTMPFVEYASHYWGGHAKREMTENVKTLALRLLDRFDEHISAQLILLRRNGDRDPIYGFRGESGPVGFTGLHAVAFLGVAGIVTAVLGMREWDINATDITGNTALTWAARCGHEEIVKMLLKQRDVNLNQADTKSGRVPLSWAALCGHEGVVKMLLERADVDPNQADTFGGRTRLWLATRHRGERVVRMRLERGGVNPKQAGTQSGRTPLSWAALRGHEGVVKRLLERKDTNANQADTKYGRTPLLWAAKYGREEVIKILLARADVDPNWVDTSGRTPFWLAAKDRNEGVVKMLLEQADVNLDQIDPEYGQTPLSWAAWGGYEGIVRILLKREDVNPNQADTETGRTPLWWAAMCGHQGVVKTLLERDVNPNRADTKSGRTPLSWAAEYGHEGVVKMLLEQADVNPNQADTKSRRTPLEWAVKRGHEGVVKMLLKRGGVSAVAPGCESQTLLPRALSKGHERIAKMLFDHDMISSDASDRAGWVSPPPSTGCGDGYSEGLLLRGDLDTHVADVNRQHALQSADPNEREPVWEIKDFPSNTIERNLSPTPQSRPSQLPPMWPLSFWCLRGKTDTHPDNTRSTLSITVDGYFVIACFLCLFAILVYILPSPPEVLSLHK